MAKPDKRRFRRFSRQDQFQHWLLVFSFSLLVLTGFVQKFSSWAVSRSVISILGGIEIVRLIHRFGAMLLMLEAVYHLGVVSYRFFVLRVRPSIIPIKDDFWDALELLQYNLGLRKERPRFGRYSFEEKFEYWAVVWGLAVMIATGFMLLNPIATTRFLPGEVIPAAKSAHGNEALLAVLAIIIWHFYNVLVRHFNKSMFTGYLSRDEMLEFHPLELAEIEAEEEGRAEPASELARRRRIFFPVISVGSVLLLIAIIVFISFEQTALETVEPAEEVVVLTPQTTAEFHSPSSGQDQIEDNKEPTTSALELMWPFSPHTDRDAEAFRYWDAEGEVDASCSTCHSSSGLPYFISNGLSVAQPISDGLFCDTCHNNTTAYTIYEIDSITFPSGVSMNENTPAINLCVSCHQGLVSGLDLDAMMAGIEEDGNDARLNFLYDHAANPGATFFGGLALGAYQYEDKIYEGLNRHVADYNSCQDCHSPHKLEVNVDVCASCHAEIVNSRDLFGIRFSRVDFDGDGNNTEGIRGEIDTLSEMLLSTIREYAYASLGANIAYDKDSPPHFFIDENENEIVDLDEKDEGNIFTDWTPRLLKASYNYHYATSNPGGFTHNPMYIIQVLYDSLESLGANVSSLTRP